MPPGIVQIFDRTGQRRGCRFDFKLSAPDRADARGGNSHDACPFNDLGRIQVGRGYDHPALGFAEEQCVRALAGQPG